ncbi:MAG: hypothetical protein MUR19_07475, partial [Paracoccaceae bacterium]|nr:hypothetical protein [Paracoccaceae bacterium]
IIMAAALPYPRSQPSLSFELPPGLPFRRTLFFVFPFMQMCRHLFWVKFYTIDHRFGVLREL